MALSTMDQLVTAMAISQRRNFLKVGTAAKAAGSFQSHWLANGFPAAGAAPPAYTAGSGYTCDQTTTGALPLTSGSIQNYLARLAASANVAGTLILADRLWACAGMGFAASTYAVTTPGSLPARITDAGLGCEIWVEQAVAAGAASGTLTVNYLDEGGAAGAGVIAAVVSAPVAGQMQPVPLAAGDLGVSGIVSAVNSASWTSGSFGITVLKRLAAIPLTLANIGNVMDWAQLALAKIPNNVCPFFFYQATATTAATHYGELNVIDK